MTVKTLSNILFSLAVKQISDKCHEAHSRHKGHIKIESASSPQIKLLLNLLVFYKSIYIQRGYLYQHILTFLRRSLDLMARGKRIQHPKWPSETTR